jgi:hypothetical protein
MAFYLILPLQDVITLGSTSSLRVPGRSFSIFLLLFRISMSDLGPGLRRRNPIGAVWLLTPIEFPSAGGLPEENPVGARLQVPLNLCAP